MKCLVRSVTMLLTPVCVCALVLGCIVLGGVALADGEEHGTVEGLVIDAEGKPVAGAQVHALGMRWKEPADPFADAVEIVTDEEGRFRAELIPRRYFVVVRKGLLTSGGAPRKLLDWSIEAGKALTDIRIPLSQGGLVTGTVVAKADGTPLADAGIILENGLVTRTDGEGSFEFVGIGLREHRIKAVHPGMADRHVDINTAGHEEFDVRIEMSPGYVVRGTVTDEQGDAVVGALVRDYYSGSIVHCKMHQCFTDEKGRYELGTYGFGRQLWSMGVEHKDFAKQSKGGLSPPEDRSVLTVDFVLDQGYAVEGYVRDTNAKPIEGAKVQYNMSVCFVHYKYTKTDDKGHFRLDKLATDREEYILAQCKDYAPAYQKVKPGQGDGVPHLEFTMQPGQVISGKITDRDGNPVEGVTVSPQMSIPGSCRGHYFAWNATTDKEGRFELHSMPKSGVSADIYKWGEYSVIRSCPLKLDGENAIVLDLPAVIMGKVIDEATGRPITKFNVKFGFPTGQRRPDEPSPSFSCHLSGRGQDCTSEEGLFTVEGLICRAPHAVIVSAEGYAPTRTDRVVAQPADHDQWPVAIKLGKGLTLTGTVTAAESGKPVADAEVVLLISPKGKHWYFSMSALTEPSRHGMTTKKVHSDAQGCFEVQGVPEDQVVRMVVRHKDYGMLIAGEIDPAKPVAAELSPGGSIEGSMKGYPGVALKDAAVWLQSRQHQGPDFDRKRGGDGTYSFKNLPAGDYSVILMHNHRNCRSMAVTLAPGQRVHIDFGKLPGARLSGQLTWHGKPVPGVSVKLHAGGKFRQSADAITDGEGRYQIAGIPRGEYLLRAENRKGPEFRPAEKPYAKTRELVTVANKDVEVNLRFHPGRITGKVVDAATGDRVAGEVSISAYPVDRDSTTPDMLVKCTLGESGERHFYATSGSWSSPRALGMLATRRLGNPGNRNEWLWGQPADDGSFELLGAAPGTYTLTVQGPDYSAPGFVTRIVVGPDGHSNPVDMRLDASGALWLRVEDAVTHKPIPKAFVSLCTPRGVFLAMKLRKPVPASEGATCPTGGCCGPGAKYTYQGLMSDDRGLVTMEGLQRGVYGIWVTAPGYCAQWVAPVLTRPAELVADKSSGHLPTTICMQPGCALVLKAARGLLAGIPSPYVVYRIHDATGHVVFPGGEAQRWGTMETGIAPLGSGKSRGYKVDALSPGRYTIAWEVRPGPEQGKRRRRIAGPALYRGNAEFSISSGKRTVVVLDK